MTKANDRGKRSTKRPRRDRGSSAKRTRRKMRLVPPLPHVTVDLETDSPEEQAEKLERIFSTLERMFSLPDLLADLERIAAEADPSEGPAIEALRAELRRFRAWAGRNPALDPFGGAVALRIGVQAALCGFENAALAGEAHHYRQIELRKNSAVRRAGDRDDWVDKARKATLKLWKDGYRRVRSAQEVAEILIERGIVTGKSLRTVRRAIADLKPKNS